MNIENDFKLGFDDVLIRPKRSTLESRNQVELERRFVFRESRMEWIGVPIMAANMLASGTFEMNESLMKYRMPTVLQKHYTSLDWQQNYLAFDPWFTIPSIGTSEKELAQVDSLIVDHGLPIRMLTIDVANGYTENFSAFVEKARDRFPDMTIIAGNVVTADMTQQLILAGADIVKVGIGPGSACSTRKVTGVGYPQLSAIMECSDAAHGMGGHIIADGGCRTPGDIAKAFGAGADFVMIGGMLAGHKESGGQRKVGHGGVTYVEHIGSSSEAANNRFFGGMSDYRASEGEEFWIVEKGSVHETISHILGGLRSACTYVGAERLKDLSKCTTFVRVSQQKKEFNV